MLFVAAFEPELAKLRELRPSVWAVPVGVGLPAAAVGTARALAGRSPKAVVLLGTCGAFPGRGLAIGDVVVAAGVRLASAAVARGEGSMPPAMLDLLACDAAPLGVRGRSVQVATTLAVTTTGELAAAMAASTGCDVEHLEAYAVALACREAGVPFLAILAVANDVGPQGRAQWAQHHQRVSDALADAVNRAL